MRRKRTNDYGPSVFLLLLDVAVAVAVAVVVTVAVAVVVTVADAVVVTVADAIAVTVADSLRLHLPIECARVPRRAFRWQILLHIELGPHENLLQRRAMHSLRRRPIALWLQRRRRRRRLSL